MAEDLLEKYPYIVAHGKMLGSKAYFLVDECNRAEEDNAPTDVVAWKENKNGDREWFRISDYGIQYQQRLRIMAGEE